MTDVQVAADVHFDKAAEEVSAGNAVLSGDTKWADSEGNVLAVENRVRVSDEAADGTWSHDYSVYTEGREFDFAYVAALNEDGTVSVEWDSAGCGCNSDGVTARVENPNELTLSSENEVNIYYRGEHAGLDEGRKSAQARLRDALGLADLSVASDDK